MGNIALTEAVYYILLSLSEPLHGYGIMQKVSSLSEGRVNLAAGTLYGATSTMLEKKWIEPVNIKQNSRKKEYKITPLGREILKEELNRLNQLVKTGNEILGGESDE